MGKTGVLGFVFALSLLAAAGAAQAQAGPVGYWKGDDGAAPTTAADSSTGNHPGSYQSGATTQASVPTLQFSNPTSMSFVTAGATVSVPGFTWPAAGGPVTVAFWNNVATAQVQNSSAFTVGNLDNGDRFHVHAPWSDSNLYWDYGDLNGTGRISTSYSAYLNKWTHVALVSAGTGGNFKAIYLDGVSVASAASSDGNDSALTGLYIGRWPSAGLQHQGGIDDFRIYNRVLTPTEIAGLAAGLTEASVPTGLTAVGSPGQILLTWNAATGATSYVLKRGLTTGGPYSTLIPVTGTTYTDTPLTPGPYFYVISAVGLTSSADSAEAWANVPPLVPRTQKLGSDHACGCSVARPDGIGVWAFSALALLTAAAALRRR